MAAWEVSHCGGASEGAAARANAPNAGRRKRKSKNRVSVQRSQDPALAGF